MSSTFIKRVEDFTCLHCGQLVQGSGYTNHCPRCLWSRHVDVHPGDRAEKCAGAMEPTSAELRGGEVIIVHTCTACGIARKIRASADDDMDAIITLMRTPPLPPRHR